MKALRMKGLCCFLSLAALHSRSCCVPERVILILTVTANPKCFFLPPAKNWGWLNLLSWVLRKSVECRTSTGHYFLQKPVKWYFRASDLETRKKKLWVCSPRSLCPPLRTKQKNQGEISKHKPPHSQTSKLTPRRLEVGNGKTWNVVLGKKSIASKKHWSAYRHDGLRAKQKQTRNGRTCLPSWTPPSPAPHKPLSLGVSVPAEQAQQHEGCWLGDFSVGTWHTKGVELSGFLALPCKQLISVRCLFLFENQTLSSWWLQSRTSQCWHAQLQPNCVWKFSWITFPGTNKLLKEFVSF